MKIIVPKEVAPRERRCAATPETVRAYVTRGFDVAVEAGLGLGAGFSDADFLAAGATVETDWQALLKSGDIILKVNPPGPRMVSDGAAPDHEADHIREGATALGFVFPKREPALLTKLASGGISAVAVDAIPRITRAQKLDALSSMANLAGYRAVVEAANAYGSFFSGQFTAAGKVKPATVLVIGAGVAGLAAIAAAHGLGAIVLAFDTREAVRDEVKSLGAKFLELEFEETGEGKGGYAKVMS
ncbi:MAG: NAD(P) transhydrogenase subunit alpha, partial [Myxococcota bacterium]